VDFDLTDGGIVDDFSRYSIGLLIDLFELIEHIYSERFLL